MFGLTACVDESISGYADPDLEYHLIDIDGVSFTSRATITFPEEGRVAGQAPCNRYFATQTEFYPWFGLTGIGATRMACPELTLEAEFLSALEDMTLAEVSGSTLILSNTDGRKMVFEAR
jgi:heat shock protein HslJ